MASQDLDTMSLEELKQLRKDVDRAITSFEARRLDAARAEVQEIAKKHGIQLSQLVSGKSGARQVQPKFKNPHNPSQVWSGRGRKPTWFSDALEAGISQDDMRI